MLREQLAGLSIAEILDSRVCNSVEHLDEDLERLNLRLQSERPRSPIAAFNIAMTDRESMSPEPYPLRVYLSASRTFVNFDVSIDIGKIYAEATAIRRRLVERKIVDDGAILILEHVIPAPSPPKSDRL